MRPPDTRSPARVDARNRADIGPEQLIDSTAKQQGKQDCVAPDVLWLRRQFIGECAAIIGSLALSLGEAAWRGSDLTVEVTLRQMRETLKTAISTFKELSAGGGQ